MASLYFEILDRAREIVGQILTVATLETMQSQIQAYVISREIMLPNIVISCYELKHRDTNTALSYLIIY